MKRLRILHLSDFHRKPKRKVDRIGDPKDKNVTKKFSNSVTDSWEHALINKLSSVVNHLGPIDVIACTGDLGDKGTSETIDEGLALLHTIQYNLNISDDHVIICPGNHDIVMSASNYCEMLRQFDISLKNYNYTDYYSNPATINGVSFFVTNSCMGYLEQSRQEIMDSINDHGYKAEIKKSLEIPAITSKQQEDIAKKIEQNYDSDFAVLLIHHNPYPSTAPEIRPYSNIVDGGKMLNRLNATKRNILILHGHIHYPQSIVASYPSYSQNDPPHFIFSLGAGKLTGDPGSECKVIELFYTDDNRFLFTDIHEITLTSSGFNQENHYSIHNISEQLPDISVITSLFPDNSKSLSLEKIKELTKLPEDIILKYILRYPRLFTIRNRPQDCTKWKISKI